MKISIPEGDLENFQDLGPLGKGVKSARGATQSATLAAATTLETRLNHPFTLAIANELLHSKHRKECNSFRPLRHCELLRPTNYCTSYATEAATPLAEATPSPNSQSSAPGKWGRPRRGSSSF